MPFYLINHTGVTIRFNDYYEAPGLPIRAGIQMAPEGKLGAYTSDMVDTATIGMGQHRRVGPMPDYGSLVPDPKNKYRILVQDNNNNNATTAYFLL